MSRHVPPAPEARAESLPGGRLFWIGTVAGAAIVIFGLSGLFTHLAASQRGDFAKWFIGADLIHDLVIAPLACMVGYIVTRLVRRPFRFPLQAGLFTTAVVLAVGWAPLRGYGRARAPDNPSVAPLNYTSAVATVLAVVWAVVAVWMIGAAVRRATGPRESSGTGQHPAPPAQHGPDASVEPA